MFLSGVFPVCDVHRTWRRRWAELWEAAVKMRSSVRASASPSPGRTCRPSTTSTGSMMRSELYYHSGFCTGLSVNSSIMLKWILKRVFLPNYQNLRVAEPVAEDVSRFECLTDMFSPFQVINFYMNLLVERSKQPNLPSTYTFNTFFYPKLRSSGYSAVRRWTKKVDIFSVDIILVPVHLGVHWCLSVSS